jgi:hypothetical protein
MAVKDFYLVHATRQVPAAVLTGPRQCGAATLLKNAGILCRSIQLVVPMLFPFSFCPCWLGAGQDLTGSRPVFRPGLFSSMTASSAAQFRFRFLNGENYSTAREI